MKTLNGGLAIIKKASEKIQSIPNVKVKAAIKDEHCCSQRHKI